MGGRQIRPARVLQTVAEEINHNLIGTKSVQQPPWFEIMQSVPPAETLVRTLPPQLSRRDRKATRPKNLFRPQPIVYLEDTLRTAFYKDHPWELARPRIIMELDGKDYQRCDWSKGLRQTGIPLTGECVVQRQMWLMDNKSIAQAEAYDITRREFYRLRQEEEIESRVAIEEARHVGAYFGLNRVAVGHIMEDRQFENWKVWAGKENAKIEARSSAEIEEFGTEELEEATAAEAEKAEATAAI